MGSFLSVLIGFIVDIWSRVCQVQVPCAVPVSDFLPSKGKDRVQLDAVSVKNRLGAYSPWSRAESCFWDASEMRCGTSGGIASIVWNGHHQHQQP